MSVAVVDLEKPCSISPYAVHKGGYVYVKREGKSWLHHRWVYSQYYGVSEEDMAGLAVLHECDTPRCIEPSHLRLGTWADNNRDRAAKGRSAKRNIVRRVLTDEQRATIAARYTRGTSGRANPNGVRALAREFNVDTNIIYKIVRGGYQ